MTTNDSPQHTPGPWIAERVTAGLAGSGMEVVATLGWQFAVLREERTHGELPPGSEGAVAEARANAYLTAAAPDTYRELRAAVLLLYDEWNGTSEDSAGMKAIRRAEAAIAKAEGKS